MNLILLSPQVKLNLLHSKTSLLIVPFNEHENDLNPILILEYFNTSEHNPNGNWQIHVVS